MTRLSMTQQDELNLEDDKQDDAQQNLTDDAKVGFKIHLNLGILYLGNDNLYLQNHII